MNTKDAHGLVEPFFYMDEFSIIDQFAQLQNDAIVHKKDPDYSYVFLPGSRKDRVLLVAHADTVWHNSHKLKVAFDGEDHGLFYSATRKKGLDKYGDPAMNGIGIGADDRAGIAALWVLSALGHSILITGGEECGCLGSYKLMSSKRMAALIQEHNFALQFDRRGRKDLVFYNVGTKEFAKFMQIETGYDPAPGSHTDICVLCEKIPGVNMSIGYANEHTVNEILNLRYWRNTVAVANNLLSKENLPKFSL